jgi:hypothetical protein
VVGRIPWPPREISGGGGTGPDQIFLGITRAPASAPGRGRAQSPVRRNPNPQTTEHERHTKAALAVKVSYSASNKRTSRFAKALCPKSVSQLRI